jgi:tetratricopeptide (TPR) repeat protein
VNRDAIEQEAMQFLQRGNSEKALERYLAILRHEPKDRRIRQKVAELCLSLGKKAEAIRHFAEVARALKAAGQERAAISIYTQLLDLSPQDNDVRVELAECLETAGRRNEARKIWEDAFQAADRREPRKAIEYARRVARLAPGEVPMHIRVAELLEGSRQEAEAFEAWKALGDEARRFGRTDDRARFFERALKLRSNDPASLLSAA